MKYENFKKMVAMATAAVMVVSAPMVALATESDDGDTSKGGTISGTGSVEDYVNKDKFKVVLPTVTDVDFTLDPQGLLEVADEETYTLGEGAVYFANVGDDGTTYSETSDVIEIVNKSSYDIDVEFSIEVTMPEGVTLVDSKEALADATTPSVYLAMQEDADSAATALVSGDNAYATKQVAGIPETTDDAVGYEIVATQGDDGYTYAYQLNSSYDDASAARAKYTITGACDTTADWSAVKDAEVAATVVWSATKHVDQAAPSIAETSYTLVADTPVEIIVDLGKGDLAATGIEKITYVNASGTVANLGTTQWTYENGKLTFTAERVNSLINSGAGKTYTVVFNDTAKTTVEITLNVATGE